MRRVMRSRSTRGWFAAYPFGFVFNGAPSISQAGRPRRSLANSDSSVDTAGESMAARMRASCPDVGPYSPPPTMSPAADTCT